MARSELRYYGVEWDRVRWDGTEQDRMEQDRMGSDGRRMYKTEDTKCDEVGWVG